MSNDPRPLKYVWVRWSKQRKWRAISTIELFSLLAGPNSLGFAVCGKHYWMGESFSEKFDITADMPDEKDCCKRCYKKVEG